MFFSNPFKSRLPQMSEAAPGRASPIMTPAPHAVHGRTIAAPFPDGIKTIIVGMGDVFGGLSGYSGKQRASIARLSVMQGDRRIRPMKRFVLVARAIVRLSLLPMTLKRFH